MNGSSKNITFLKNQGNYTIFKPIRMQTMKLIIIELINSQTNY